MAKSKKNNALLHPIDTVMHWYKEVQAIPAQLKRNFARDQKSALNHIKKLTVKFEKAGNLQRKAQASHSSVIQKMKQKSTQATRALVKKSKSHYAAAHRKVEKIKRELDAAKTQLSHAKIKQKYYDALEAALLSVTQLFSKKHGHLLGKKGTHHRRMGRSRKHAKK